MDCIFIDSLEVKTTIGTLAWEQAAPQSILIHLSLWLDTQQAAASDNLDHCVDYSKICSHITEWCASRQTNLIEKLSNDLANELLQTFNLTKIMLTLIKPGAIKHAKGVGITLTRERV